ncbi:peptide deformylase [Paenibacillus sp. IITD108]|uniref:peptide deformylase n=2 Tax=unclassified Paenibacillus TaxID=185978 RepID=UPI002F4089DF
MTVKDILPFGNSLLRKKCKPVDAISSKTVKLLDDMGETLYAADGRAGLAAPQIGILRRVVVMDCGEGLIELINPEIVKRSGEQTGLEACLSFPNYVGTVTRSQYVKIKSWNRAGKQFYMEAEGFLARCIQHELDHLDGILYIDHVKDELIHEVTGRKISVLEAIKLANSGS